jgi:hypothetical protein
MFQITDAWLFTKSCVPYFCTTFCLVCRFWRRYKRKGLGGELLQFWKLLYRHSTSFPGDLWKFPSSCRIRTKELSLYPGRLVWSRNGMNGWTWLFRVGSRSGGWIRTAFTTYFARIMKLGVLIRSLPCCLCVGPVCGIVKISVFSAGSVSLLVRNKMESSTQILTFMVAPVLPRIGIHLYN